MVVLGENVRDHQLFQTRREHEILYQKVQPDGSAREIIGSPNSVALILFGSCIKYPVNPFNRWIDIGITVLVTTPHDQTPPLVDVMF